MIDDAVPGSRSGRENHNIPVKLIGFLYWNFVMIEFSARNNLKR
jgi:hypothetical protein